MALPSLPRGGPRVGARRRASSRGRCLWSGRAHQPLDPRREQRRSTRRLGHQQPVEPLLSRTGRAHTTGTPVRSAEPRRLAHEVVQPLADGGAHGIGSAQHQHTIEPGGDVVGHAHLNSQRLGRPFFDPSSDDQQSWAIAGEGLVSSELVIRHQVGIDCSKPGVDSRGGGGCQRRSRVGFSARGLITMNARQGAVTGPSPRVEVSSRWRRRDVGPTPSSGAAAPGALELPVGVRLVPSAIWTRMSAARALSRRGWARTAAIAARLPPPVGQRR